MPAASGQRRGHYGQVCEENLGSARSLREQHSAARSLPAGVWRARGAMCKKATGIQLMAFSVKQERLRLWGSSLPIDRSGWPKTRPERRAKGRTRPALRVGNKSGQTWPARAGLSKSQQAP